MIINQREDRHAQVIDVARRMMTAIRTAPKAKGNDLIETILVEGDDLRRLSDAMLALYDETSRPVYQRDAANILQGDAVVLVGIRQQPMGLNCGHCGYPGCTAKPEQSPCAFNSIDVGIAIGSACSPTAASTPALSFLQEWAPCVSICSPAAARCLPSLSVPPQKIHFSTASNHCAWPTHISQ